MSQYLSEAFKSLDSLNEDVFSIDENGLQDLVKFEEEDEDTNIIDIIDAEAETHDDLEDSYEGKIILDCSICHSKQYKNIEDIVIEGDLANIGEECPFCYTNDGFKVIGQVAPFNKEEAETEEEEKPEETKIDKEDTELKEAVGTLERPISKITGTLGNVLTAHADELAQVYDAQSAITLLDKLEPEISQKDYLKKVKLDIMRAPRKAVNYLYNIILKGDGMGRENESLEEGIFGKKKPAQKPTTAKDKKWQVYDCWDKIVVGEYDTKPEAEDSAASRGHDGRYKVQMSESTKHNAIHEDGYGAPDENPIIAWIGEHEQAWEDFTSHFANKDLNTLSDDEILNWISEHDQLWDDYKRHFKVNESKSIKESVNNVNVETDEDVINVATDDNGKVTVTTEPKTTENTAEDAEVITPIEPEVQNEIKDNVANGDEIEIDVDEFDEESFDELGESYLKKIYENVDTYKTSQVSLDNNTLKVEGVIKFKSGNTKKTSFLFEARTATKTGMVKFIGENTQITKGKKAFTITGNINNKKFLSESLTYNYGAKTPEGKTKRLYGTIKK